jgi:hypothetical protein
VRHPAPATFEGNFARGFLWALTLSLPIWVILVVGGRAAWAAFSTIIFAGGLN